MERESMIFYKGFFEAIKDLPPEEFKKCACAILEYGINGVEPETKGIEKTVYLMAKPQIDKNIQRYENGKNGGRPRNQTETEEKPNNNQTETEEKPNKTEPEPNVNVNVNDNVKDNNHFTACGRARVYEESEIMTCADFLDKHKNVIVDTNLVYGLDWNLLDERFNESKKYLSQPHALSWIKNNYAKIIQGYYKDKTTVKSETKFDCMEFLDGITEQLKARGNET